MAAHSSRATCVLMPVLLRIKRAVRKALSQISTWRLERRCRRKITRIYAQHDLRRFPIDRNLIAEHVRIWHPLKRTVNTKWLSVYVYVSGIRSAQYIPEDVFYGVVQPCLNYKPMHLAFSDKNLYDKKAYAALFPATVLRCINSVLYDPSYTPLEGGAAFTELLKGYDEVIAKPAVGSGGGRSVCLFRKTGHAFVDAEGHVLTPAHLSTILGDNYIIQEKLVEHESLSRYNPSSVNTVRIFTYRSVSSEEVIPLCAVLRIGRPGSLVDNQAAGGISVGIDSQGVLGKFAIDKTGSKRLRVGHLDLNGIHRVLQFSDMVEVAKRIAREYVYARVLGFDMMLDATLSVKVIEINNGAIEINFHQMTQGPLFGPYTHEVVDYCVRARHGADTSM